MYLLWTIWNWLQKFWGLNPDLFLAKFHIFYPFYYRTNFCFHWPKFPSESSPLDCPTLQSPQLCKGEQVLKEPQTISDKFSFFFLVLPSAKTLFLLANRFVRIASYEMGILCQGGWGLRDDCLYLEQFGIGSKKFQKIHPEIFLTYFLILLYATHFVWFFHFQNVVLSSLLLFSCAYY